MNKKRIKILSVVGARPNFVKIAPLVKEFKKFPVINHILIHTGQHYDNYMSDSFINDLEISRPHYNLNVGPGKHGEQTGKILIELEKHFIKHKPHLVLVVGDVNSTVAASLAATKLGIDIVHVEAGLRSFDRDMPEEINRIITDQLSNYLFTHEDSAHKNLTNEGVSPKKIHFVGNIMIDTLKSNIKKTDSINILDKLQVSPNNYVLLTLHRPSNVDIKENLLKIINSIETIQKKVKVIWPVHPRTKQMIKKFNLINKIEDFENLIITKPLPYLIFLKLMISAKFVLTDSGGIQEETTALGIPCLTIRNNTERPITVSQGTNTIVGTDTNKIINESQKIINGIYKKGKIPKYWDGKTAERIVKIIIEQFRNNI